jgi:hypothetical protein
MALHQTVQNQKAKAIWPYIKMLETDVSNSFYFIQDTTTILIMTLPGNTKGGSIIVLLTSCLAISESFV